MPAYIILYFVTLLSLITARVSKLYIILYGDNTVVPIKGNVPTSHHGSTLGN